MRLRDWDKNLKIRLIGEALMNVTFWMFFPFLTIYFTESFGKGTAGVLLIGSQIFSVIANLLGGYYADRYGRKKMMVISACGQGIAFFIFAITNMPVIGFICFSVASIFGSFYYPASQAMVADVVNEKDRSDVFAVFYTSTNIAVVIGPLVGGIFFAYYRFELLLASAFVCIVLAFLLWKFTRETSPIQEKREDQSDKWHQVLKKQFSSYGIIFKDRVFLLFIVAGVLIGQTFMQLDLLIPVYTKEAINKFSFFQHFTLNGEQIYGFILSENGFLVALFTVSITRWVAKFKEKKVFILSCICYAISMYFFAIFPNLWGFVIAMAIFSLGELVVAGIQQTFISKLAPEHMRGQYFAAASLRYTIARTIAPISIPLASFIGYFQTFNILAIIAVLSAGIYIIMFNKLQTKQKSI
ncbi:MFS transporter [Heyndrickxia sporothermodurans]|uniref:MFS transporter n=1 Tax=Heyndrickxia sporothermodurans TaxID=46224 RepID=A0AB37HB19_9BACI|nr:MFS transporter [Heyndrickxia sporothermodurans]MBL5768382.1 MFS transporter [Heyndrickxia sporothermodurans]MBL5772024.1 MFS transporter [Heyndrickxia sporothermodurans]MBL5775987.1 MFS transporter [Heyndrickxia sporothermodurans]MBL5779534.1 MFS transporter [Heyndrickxia sporothermodurans]MBL5786282.1 MFS transporter [Heyndrickxia sporothermodurans]